MEKPKNPPSEMISMTLYMFKKDCLVDLLTANAQESSHEFGKDIIPRLLTHTKVFAFQHHGYWAYARTIDSYFHTNMDLLRGRIDISEWQIRTNFLERSAKRDRLPAHINGPVHNSVISDECVIEGSVSNSILSPGVRVAKEAEVRDCIIFHDTRIGRRSTLNKVICDKDVSIGEGVAIGIEGVDTPSREFKELLNSGISVIGRKVNIPDNITVGANTVIYSGARMHGPIIEAGSTHR
jgi:glucose-1-phosphate adenylyltransferase